MASQALSGDADEVSSHSWDDVGGRDLQWGILEWIWWEMWVSQMPCMTDREWM